MASASIASRIASLKSLVQSFPRSLLSEPTQLSEAWVSILDRTLTHKTDTTSVLDGLNEDARGKSLVRFQESVKRLKSGKAMHDYPLPKYFLTPPNDEFYYTRARNAFYNAERGIKRPWWKVFFNLKGTE